VTQPLSREQILARIPQQEPFRFVDEILEIDDKRVVGTYRWRPDADFYRGHFPGNPVTPGVLLVESMAQCGIVPLAIHLIHRDFPEKAETLQTLFTDAQIEFSGIVKPGERVTIESTLVFWRHRKLKVEATMQREDGSQVCSGQLAGLGVAL